MKLLKGILFGFLVTSPIVLSAQAITGLKTDKYCWQVDAVQSVAQSFTYSFVIDSAPSINLPSTCTGDNPSSCTAIPPITAMTTGNHSVTISPTATTTDGRPNPGATASFTYTIIAAPAPVHNFKLIALISSIIGLLGFVFARHSK